MTSSNNLPKWLAQGEGAQTDPTTDTPKDGDPPIKGPKTVAKGQGPPPPRIYVLMVQSREALFELLTTKGEIEYAENAKRVYGEPDSGIRTDDAGTRPETVGDTSEHKALGTPCGNVPSDSVPEIGVGAGGSGDSGHELDSDGEQAVDTEGPAVV